MGDWQYPTTGRPAPATSAAGARPGAAGAGSGPPAPAYRTLPAGYELLRPLGSGRISEVLLCRERSSGRDLAVTLLALRIDDERRQLAVHTELLAAVVAARHPCAVAVQEVGFTDAGQPYLAVEYCPGGSAEVRLGAYGPLPVDEVLVAGVRVAAALAAAHRRGVLHLDVRPANLLIDAAGELLLTGHGVARVVERADPAGGARFDPAYAARELFGWEPPGPATDVYGLGATLHALLTGAPPGADEVGRADAPAALLALVERMTAANPEERPPLTEVERVLRALLPAALAARVPAVAAEPEEDSDQYGPSEASAPQRPAADGGGLAAEHESRRAGRRRLAVVGGVTAAAAVVVAAGLVLASRDDTGPGPGGRQPEQTEQPGGGATAAAVPVPAELRAGYLVRGARVTQFGQNLMVAWSEPRNTAGVSGYLVVAQTPSGGLQARQYALNGQLNVVFTVPPATARSCFVVTTLVTRGSQLELARGEPVCRKAGRKAGAG